MLGATQPIAVKSYSEQGEGEWCRRVESRFTPYIGQEFTELEEAVNFYKIYALACGFNVRRFTTKRWRDGSIKSKLLVCNREGFAQRMLTRSKKIHTASTDEESEQEVGECSKRNVKLTRVGCQARIRLFMKAGVLVVDKFYEGHNHELCSMKDREFQKLSRNLSTYHKEIIVQNSRLKIGATKTYRMCKEHVKGFENLGADLIDFKNFQRDVKCFIGQQDGQMFIERLKNMSETREGFYFDYDVDDDGRLCRVIWSDAVARRSYSVFGDALSYDPTYSTNKYFMIFTPFTGVDHHKRSVTFAGALIAHEDFESFNWVFSRFLIAMGGKEPEYIITDQDPAIIKSIKNIFVTARHRFCMWHIMNKVPSKFGVARNDYSGFLKKLNEIVWDEDIEATEFDTKWNEVMVGHGVGINDWFEETFNIRDQWVMAHCRGLKMGGVMRTTQRSESGNSFFKRFEDKAGTLVEFWMRFESAMDQQRHSQKKLDNQSRHSSPKLLSHLPIESHGSKIYTHDLFSDFQNEVKYSMTTCSVGGFSKTSDLELTIVQDAGNERSFVVKYNRGTVEVSCTCRLFERKGILCRHIIWIYAGKSQQTIPVQYIATRWTKNAMYEPVYDDNGNLTGDNDIIDGKQIEMSKLWSEFYETIGMLGRRCKADIEGLCTLIREFREKLEPKGDTLTKHKEIEQLLGCASIKEITILPPKQSKNKGSGKRMLSSKTKAIEISSKPKRMCKNCKRMGHHDKRNCPNPYAEHPPPSVDSSAEEDDQEEDEDDLEDDVEEEEEDDEAVE